MALVKRDVPEIPPVRKKIRPRAHGGHHGGAWKVAYADFITTMMALFLLLWLMSATDQQSKNIISLYFKDPGVFDNAQGQNLLSGSGSSRKSQAVPISEVAGHGKAGQGGADSTVSIEDVQKALQRALHAVGPRKGLEQQVLFTPTPDGLLIQIVDSGVRPLFASGKTSLLPEGRHITEQLGQLLALLPDYELSLAGHTDREPFPNSAIYTNWDLSLDRAQEAARILLESGVPVRRIRSVTGFADTSLLNPDDPFDPKNRRISIQVKRRSRVGAAASEEPLHESLEDSRMEPPTLEPSEEPPIEPTTE